MSYTDIVAPIAGRTGIRLIDEGNLVKASDTTGIVVITQLQPISVFFSLPQQVLPELNRGLAEGVLPVAALGADGKTVLDRGKVVVIDNQVDPTTGTVKIKGEFPNADLQLWPGQFVNIQLLIDTLRQVVVVPTAAVQRGPTGPFVYVVKDDSTVGMRPVTLTKQDDREAVLGSGVRAGDRVVTTGFARLTDGTRVAVTAPAPDAGRGADLVGGSAGAAERRQSRPRRDAGQRGAGQGPDAGRRVAGHDAMSVSSPFIYRPDRDVAARRRDPAGRAARLLRPAGVVAAAGRLSRASRSPRNCRAPAPTPWRRW